MTFARMKYFVEVARCQNLTAAAQRLYTSQPNLSKQIAILENEVGAKLFIRTNRSVCLTSAGRYLYEQFKDFPEFAENVFEQTRALSRGDTGKISIGILDGQDVSIVLAKRFERFSKAHPEIEYEMDRNGFSGLRRGLDNYTYDLIITLSFELADLEDVSHTTLLEQSGAIAVNKSNPLASLENPTLADFADEDFICISPKESRAGYDQLIRQCQDAGFTPRIVREANSNESLQFLVEAGVGVSMFDRNTRLENNSAVRIFQLDSAERPDVVAVWKTENRNPNIVSIAEGLV